MIKAYNLASDTTIEFDAATAPVWAVAYGYCEENNLLSWLFSHAHDKNNAWETALPIRYGRCSVSCGDWAARLV